MKQSSSKIDISTFASLHWRNLLPPKTNPKSLRTFSHTHHQLNIKRHLTPCPTAPKNLRTLTPRLEVRTPEAGEKISAAQISNKGASRRVSFWDGLKLHEPRRRLRAWASLGTKPRKGTSAQSFVNIAILLPSHFCLENLWLLLFNHPTTAQENYKKCISPRHRAQHLWRSVALRSWRCPYQRCAELWTTPGRR